MTSETKTANPWQRHKFEDQTQAAARADIFGISVSCPNAGRSIRSEPIALKIGQTPGADTLKKPRQPHAFNAETLLGSFRVSPIEP
jgi:hypothetical protein